MITYIANSVGGFVVEGWYSYVPEDRVHSDVKIHVITTPEGQSYEINLPTLRAVIVGKEFTIEQIEREVNKNLGDDRCVNCRKYNTYDCYTAKPKPHDYGWCQGHERIQ